ncbi:MAG TPA: exo-alpha-sialidase [Casimicrobiaceae bacterium]|nr:exo-alpha-sialidase [Casimicrobiaceae bacterium]
MRLDAHRVRARFDVHRARTALVAFALAFATPVSGETVVEYYHAGLDHYFMTPLASEIAALDGGLFFGWGRTGFTFEGFAAPSAGTNAVCRFYIPPEHGSSHFFSASPDECAVVRERMRIDPAYAGYIEETSAEFYIALPDTSTGACRGGTVPVYRLWNQRVDSNHRYTTDRATRDAMIARGYRSEGYGALGVAMCTPQGGIGDSRVRVTGGGPFADGCDRVPATGTVYAGGEVEPHVAVDPQNPLHLIGAWQQDRWSDGGARGLRIGYSFDGGLTWSLTQAAFTRCTGGDAANGTDYARASDPWVAIGPDGIAYQSAIAFNGNTFAPGSSGSVLASRSLDGGRTWSAPATLIRDGTAAFNDKESITADPLAPGYAYATWDRLEPNGHGPTYLARTTDGGASWEPARAIYDPGGVNQTLNNQIVVATGGAQANALYAFFTEFIAGANGTVTTRLAFVRSNDRGVTWSGATRVADLLAVGGYDPQNPALAIRDGAAIASVASGPNGVLVAAWQDSRFSNAVRDGVAFSRSVDGGSTWSTPVQINAVPATQALMPAISVRADGTIGVLYYDFRNDTADASTLLCDVWLATSVNGSDWTEHHVAGPFDMRRAPVTPGGLFVGDYQALTSASGKFMAFFTQAAPDAANPTDIWSSVLLDGGTAFD